MYNHMRPSQEGYICSQFEFPNLSFHILRRKQCGCWYCTIEYVLFSVIVTVSTHLCVVRFVFCCLMSLFQGHVTCQNNFILTGVIQCIQLFQERLSEKMCTRQPRKVIWDMINTLFLMTVDVEPTFVAFHQQLRTYVCGLACHSFKLLWRTGQTKPPTIPFGIVPCTFSDDLSQNSCMLHIKIKFRLILIFLTRVDIKFPLSPCLNY